MTGVGWGWLLVPSVSHHPSPRACTSSQESTALWAAAMKEEVGLMEQRMQKQRQKHHDEQEQSAKEMARCVRARAL